MISYNKQLTVVPGAPVIQALCTNSDSAVERLVWNRRELCKQFYVHR